MFALLWLAASVALPLAAHQQPTTLVVLDVVTDDVTMNLHVPLSELELAFGQQVTDRPKERLATWQPAFERYLLEHIQPVTEAGVPWLVRVGEMQVGDAEQTQSGPFQEILVRLKLVPPAGAGVRQFVLRYDAILHQVVTHKVLVSVQRDWAGGVAESGPSATPLGMIAVDTGTGQIAPLAVRLGEGSWWAGFQGMVKLGAEHIRAGTDHLLFLLVLLLPATLRWRGQGWARRWSGFGGSRYSIMRLVKIVTAFTVGHSLTLLAGAMHVLTLPHQPVEVLIAISILVTAVHAWRPLFPGNETRIAAGFGLVHGLAFATVMADLQLRPGPMALSILGFNLGIEAMQLFVIAMTMPWLLLLSRTPAHSWVRRGGAVLAGIAAVGWIANRVSGQSNEIERMMTLVTGYAPLGILALAAVTLAAYGYSSRAGMRPVWEGEVSE